MLKLYIVPVEIVGNYRGPEYFAWRFDANGPSIACRWSAMDYGFLPYMLVVAHDIVQADHDALVVKTGVYAFPDNLDQSIPPNTLNTYFEAINVPTDWLTPATTYRQFLRYMAGMFQFNQAFGGQSGGQSLFGGGITLESNWNGLSAQQKAWFNAALQQLSPGAPGVTGNPKLRTLAKRAGDLWGANPFVMGGFEF